MKLKIWIRALGVFCLISGMVVFPLQKFLMPAASSLETSLLYCVLMIAGIVSGVVGLLLGFIKKSSKVMIYFSS